MFFIMGKKGQRHNNKKPKNKKMVEECVEEGNEQGEGVKKCPHLSKAVKLGVLQNHIPHIRKLGQCSFCDDDQSGVCICLRCSKQGCDRYSAGQHGLAHYSDCPSHSITLHLQSMLVWCYTCDLEISVVPNTDLHECVKLIIKGLKLNIHNDLKFDLPNLNGYSKDETDECRTSHLTINHARKVKGLVNLGNTCFFNAVMQNLNQTELLHAALSFINQEEYSQRILDENHQLKLTVQVTNPAGSLIVSLNKLLSEFRSSSPGPLSPKFLFSEICKKAPRFRGFQQQDSQELLRYLLDSVKTEQLKRVKIGILKHFEGDEGVGIKNLPEEKKDEIKEYVNLVSAPSIDSIFAGKLDSIVVCHRCHTQSRVRESFLDLSLSLVEPQELKAKQKATKGFVFGKKKNNSNQTSQAAEITVDKPDKLSKHQQKAAKEAKRRKGKRKGRQRTSSRSISEDDAKHSPENLSDAEEAPNDPEATEQEESPKAETSNEISTPESDEKPKLEVTLEKVTEENKNPLLIEENVEDTKGDATSKIGGKINVSAEIENDVISDRSSRKPCDVENDVIAAPSQENSIDIQSDIILNDVTFEGGSAHASKFDHIENQTNAPGKSSLSGAPTNATKQKDGENQSLELEGNVSTIGLQCERDSVLCDVEQETIVCSEAIDSRSQPIDEVQSTTIQSIQSGENSRCVNNLVSGIENLDVRGEDEENSKKEEEENSNLQQVEESQDIKSENILSETIPEGSEMGEHESEGKDQEYGISLCEEKNEEISKEVLQESKNGLHNTVTKTGNISNPTIDINSENCGQSDSTDMNTKYGTHSDVTSDNDNSTSSPRVFTIAPPYSSTPGECSVLSCLSQFCSPEVLEGRNKFACEECSKKNHENSSEDDEQASSSDDGSSKGASAPKPTPRRTIVLTEATKQLLLTATPPVLTLHLKRFQQVGFGLKKIAKHVDFPLVLDLAPFCSRGEEISTDSQNQVLYSLIGVVEHSGGLNSGHYTANVKLKYKPTYGQPSTINDFATFIEELWKKDKESSYVHERPGDGQWYYVSDSRVTMVTEEKVLRSQAYMLFYERLPLKETALR